MHPLVRSVVQVCLGFLVLIGSTALCALRARQDLLAENLLLRHQLTVLRRSVLRPKLSPLDRMVLMLVSRFTRTWRGVLRIVQPETLVRWHRAGFRRFWRWKSRPTPRRRALDCGTVALIREMAADNALWGAERIRGELLKLGIRVSKRSIQKYLRPAGRHSPRGQSWATFLKNHGPGIWACDFLQTYDVLFRPIFAFVVIELATRRIRHVAATRSPSRAWIVEQLRRATGGALPRFLVCDNDRKYGAPFVDLARRLGIAVVRTAPRAPNMNAICERFLGSLRRECLDHVIVFGARHLARVVRAYAGFHNAARPHQALAQRTPLGRPHPGTGAIVARPVLGGLHHDYRRAA